ncbi:MAG TPA: DUF362 domain-containing protein [Firmicutes bacterium]|nr:DUF362 domain-containing protein [Bacillota bacterium]
MSTVVLIKAEDYAPQTMARAFAELDASLDEMGVRLMPVPTLIKPNLLCAAPPEAAVCTHPAVVEGLVGLLHRKNITDLSLGDSPGFGSLERVAKSAGMEKVCGEGNVSLVRFSPGVEVAVEGQRIRRAVIAQPVAQARQIINVAKLKTHGLMGFTGAVKNLFGCIPGTEKATMHLRLADREHFAGMLVDLYLALKPQLSIIDGIVAMEGQGPRQGNPRPVGLLIAGTDGVAVDAVACAVVGIDPMSIPTIRVAHQQGVGQGDLTKIRILGAPLEEVQVRDFKPAETSVTLGGVPKPIWNLLQKQLTSRPYIITERCVGCGVCARCCPADTIVLDKTAKIVDDKCIRCYCCHELCPEDAVGLAPGFLQRVIGFFRK